MTRWLTKWRLALRLGTPMATGIVAALYLKADFLEKVSQELIALLGLFMAAVLPTMILTATVLRAGDLSVKRIADLRSALVRQVRLWAGLFLISLAACATIVVGKALEWKLSLPLPARVGVDLELGWIFNFLAIGLCVFLLIRARTVLDGIISLINLSAEISSGEARKRDETAHERVDQSIAKIKNPEGFGKYVDISPRRTRRSK